MSHGPQQRWLATIWPKVESRLPPPPARVVEVGCGALGGFVPMLLDSGYDALGIDPVAPDGDSYLQVEVERAELAEDVDVFIACTSLHHVADPPVVIDRIADALRPGGLIVVVEWDWEGFDEATARWCFERLGSAEGGGSLHHHRDAWAGSGQPWDEYLRGWAEGHGIHSVRRLIDDLDRRFQRLECERGACCFEDLPETDEAEELEAINAGLIRALRIDYVGRVD